MEFWRIFLLGTVIVGLFQTGLTKPSPSGEPSLDDKEDDYDNVQGDDADNYDYEDEENSSIPDNGSRPSIINAEDNNINNRPYLDKYEDTITVRPGENVKIDCNVKNLGSSLIMWYLGEGDNHLLAQGSYSSSEKISMDNVSSALNIHNVQPEDANLYVCHIVPGELRYRATLEVMSQPSLFITDSDRDITERALTYQEGDRINIFCNASGLPAPTITWASGGKRLDRENDVIVDNGRLIIERVNHNHGGIYQCLADNGIGKPAHGSVTINVQFSPKVTVHHRAINTGEGYDANLHCLVASEPESRTTWYKNGKELNNFKKYSTTSDVHKNHNRVGLIIKKVEKSDLGVYECHVSNAIGKGTANVSLIYEPEPAHFVGYDLHADDEVQLNWTVKSIQPLSEVMLFYRKSIDKQWQQVKPIIAEKHHQHSGLWKIQHRVQLSPGQWHARIRARNSEGWSKHSEAETINVPHIVSDDEERDLKDSDATEHKASSAERNIIHNLSTIFYIGILWSAGAFVTRLSS